MNNLITLLFIGGLLYFMFRKGGMGCCGGHVDHAGHDSSDTKYKNGPVDPSTLHNEQSSTADPDEVDYVVLPLNSKEK